MTLSRSARSVLQFAFVFGCVFGGLALPSPPLAHLYVRAHATLGNALLGDAVFERGVTLGFEDMPDATSHPWQLTLRIHDPLRAGLVSVPIDLRTLLFLPLITFVGLCSATRLGTAWDNLRLLALGLAFLEPLLLLLTALPILSFLGGTGPVQAFSLSRPVHVVLQTLYRALVAPPGMTYAVPLLLWWVLVAQLHPQQALAAGKPVTD